MFILMSTEFDWFMVTMPIFAIVVYAIVMVGSMEKQPKFLESKQTEKIVVWAFGGLFRSGCNLRRLVDVRCFLRVAFELLTSCRFSSSATKATQKCLKFLFVRLIGRAESNVFLRSHMASGSFELPLFSGMPSNCCSCDLDN